MRPLILLALMAMPALADSRIEQVSWGSNEAGEEADRFIHFVAKPTDARNAINLFVHAYDKAGVKSVAITSGVKVLGSCSGTTCTATWQKSAMAATNNMLVTVTATDGKKFTMPTRVSRP